MLSAGIVAGPAPELVPVEMDGVVKAVMQDDLDIDWYRVEFATPSNTINVAIAAKTAAYDALYRMIDAKMRVTGKMWLDTNRLHPKHSLHPLHRHKCDQRSRFHQLCKYLHKSRCRM